MSGQADLVAHGLRSADIDRYVSVLYAPAPKRRALFALYAFNAEIASIRDRVSQPLPGEVRLQWWRDVLDAGTIEGAGGNPIAAELMAAVRDHQLPIAPLQAMLIAREFDLYEDPMPTRTYLEGYLGETNSALIQLAAVILDPKAAPDVATASGHAGCAQGIAGLLRLLPLHRSRGQCFIPKDLLAAAGTTAEMFVARKDEAAAFRALQAMLALGYEHLNAQRRNPLIPGQLLPAFQPTELTGMYLDAIAGSGTKALTVPATVSQWRKQLRLFGRALLPLGYLGN